MSGSEDVQPHLPELGNSYRDQYFSQLSIADLFAVARQAETRQENVVMVDYLKSASKIFLMTSEVNPLEIIKRKAFSRRLL